MYKALKCRVQPRVGREEGFRPETEAHKSLGLQLQYRKLRILNLNLAFQVDIKVYLSMEEEGTYCI